MNQWVLYLNHWQISFSVGRLVDRKNGIETVRDSSDNSEEKEMLKHKKEEKMKSNENEINK